MQNPLNFPHGRPINIVQMLMAKAFVKIFQSPRMVYKGKRTALRVSFFAFINQEGR